jgi:hypothetical protein
MEMNRAGGITQVVESLPNKYKALTSNSSTAKKMKRQATNWRKMYAKHRCNKEFRSRIYEELLKLINKET